MFVKELKAFGGGAETEGTLLEDGLAAPAELTALLAL
jgi:hypothetical protein